MSKPIEMKRIAGTIQPCRDAAKIEAMNSMSLLESLPDAPEWLPNAHAAKEWYNTGNIMIGYKMLTVGDLPALGQMCALHGKIVQLYSAGECPGASMIGALSAFYTSFGMTPMSRVKVKVGLMDKPEVNKFSKNGTRNR
jgi:phage terminase small subunit